MDDTVTEKLSLMADERTPLIQIVQVRPATQRYSHNRIRQCCTTLLATVPTIVLITLLVCIFFPGLLDGYDQIGNPFRFPGSSSSIIGSWPRTQGIDYADLEQLVIETPDRMKAREWSEYYTSGPHLAGKNFSQAMWTRDRWQEFGIPQTEIITYDIYVNYPIGHRLALLENAKNNATLGEGLAHQKSWRVSYEAVLEEDVLSDDPTSGLAERIPTFHGYSASGNVTAPYVFVNYGSYEDYEDLLSANVSLTGKIALIKYGGIFRGLKVKRAQDLGMIGAVIYSDPGDDGDVTEANGVKTYPDGPARNPSSVQRGSTQFLSFAPGDPTTPGYPSKPGAPRQPVDHAIPKIPSIPISYLDALPLLKALNGHGPKASSFNKYWQGGGLGRQGVDYNIGPSPDDLHLNLVNEQEYVTTPMWNVIGIINGTISDEVVVIGNHRDAWIAGGAGDPNSGSAALNEVIRSLGKAVRLGWKPLRTIVFASWDGEEYGLIGSTEWVEEYLPWLSASAVAYLNVDVGTSGPSFRAAAAPLLNKILVETVNSVQSPNQTISNQTIGDVWSGHIYTMGSGSDFTAFQDFAGIPCVDMGFKDGPKSPIYHYHSNYDSFAWMDTYGDPGFHYHEAISRLWALLTIRVVESPVLPFNATDYADNLKAYVDRAKSQAKSAKHFDYSDDEHVSSKGLLFDPLDEAIARLRNGSVALDAVAAELNDKIARDDTPWWHWWGRLKLYFRVRRVNAKYKYLERQFLYEKGLDGRSWFKHVVFAPGKWTGYSGATFPGIVESVQAGDYENAQRWIGIVASLVNQAASSLSG